MVLTGQAESGSTLISALQQQQKTGQIPLDLRAHAPMAVKLGKLKTRKVKILGKCKLVVDSLSPNNINIKANNCKFRLKL
ncbi:putative aquaporin TIP-type alpha [Hibiscus syriacus]|uniref:Aquaporin TIP-type alpha n=1 Tax=Hibiscus syriacus TaxID=106335 RepID=A0A6A3BPG4_HIBSY|nr:putative aquaporin TIP-type alpha [Hibiscus syriacus]